MEIEDCPKENQPRLLQKPSSLVHLQTLPARGKNIMYFWLNLKPVIHHRSVKTLVIITRANQDIVIRGGTDLLRKLQCELLFQASVWGSRSCQDGQMETANQYTPAEAETLVQQLTSSGNQKDGDPSCWHSAKVNGAVPINTGWPKALIHRACAAYIHRHCRWHLLSAFSVFLYCKMAIEKCLWRIATTSYPNNLCILGQGLAFRYRTQNGVFQDLLYLQQLRAKIQHSLSGNKSSHRRTVWMTILY